MGKPKLNEGASVKDKKAFAQFLSEDEELILATGYGKNYMRHKYALYLMVLWLVLLPVGFFIAQNQGYAPGYGVIAGFILSFVLAYLKALWTYHSHRYLLTTRRVIIKHGYFTVKLSSALYDKITHIEVDQGVMDRLIMRHGTVLVHTAGGNSDELRLINVDNPIEVKNMLERLINRERGSYSRASGPVLAVEGELVEEG